MPVHYVAVTARDGFPDSRSGAVGRLGVGVLGRCAVAPGPFGGADSWRLSPPRRCTSPPGPGSLLSAPHPLLPVHYVAVTTRDGFPGSWSGAVGRLAASAAGGHAASRSPSRLPLSPQDRDRIPTRLPRLETKRDLRFYPAPASAQAGERGFRAPRAETEARQDKKGRTPPENPAPHTPRRHNPSQQTHTPNGNRPTRTRPDRLRSGRTPRRPTHNRPRPRAREADQGGNGHVVDGQQRMRSTKQKPRPRRGRATTRRRLPATSRPRRTDPGPPRQQPNTPTPKRPTDPDHEPAKPTRAVTAT
ncbi:hypothetical protein ABIA38_009108 [Embleya sp. AB8]